MAINRIKTGGITDNTIQSGDLAPGTIASDRIAPGTIANDRLANNTITINGTSIALGASGEIVAGTDWQAVTVADGSTLVNATAGQGLLLDTNAGVIEVVLPGSPSRGDTIKIVDYGGTFATNKCLVNLNGSFLDSTNLGYFNLTTNDTLAEFVYIDANKGWLFYQNSTQASTPSSALEEGELSVTNERISATGGTIATVDTDYKVHTFTGDGCFVVTAGAGPFAKVDYLVIAGGGGSGGSGRGGAGAGGYREAKTGNNGCHTASPLATPVGLQVNPGTYPITVGAGGSGAVRGSNSIFSTITSTGGGGSPVPEGPGGSGAGATAVCVAAGTGNTPPVSPSQGNPGGINGQGTCNRGGGGGGAGAAGSASNPSQAGNGGNGVTSEISGSPSTDAGGGGGGAHFPGYGNGTGGSGGGGLGGAFATPGAGANGVANSGGGAGGGGGRTGVNAGADSNGGKGIVIIRYKFQ